MVCDLVVFLNRHRCVVPPLCRGRTTLPIPHTPFFYFSFLTHVHSLRTHPHPHPHPHTFHTPTQHAVLPFLSCGRFIPSLFFS